MKDGHGKMIWADDSYYEGSLSLNKLSGHGKLVWADGRSYEGMVRVG